MNGSDTDDRLFCRACGSLLDEGDRAYQFAADVTICFPCAIQRGGAYDDGQDRWTRNPDVSEFDEPEL